MKLHIEPSTYKLFDWLHDNAKARGVELRWDLPFDDDVKHKVTMIDGGKSYTWFDSCPEELMARVKADYIMMYEDGGSDDQG